ncbi:MAG: hypothetical protein RSF67_00390 [Clostridia bacterium]
MNIKEIIKDNTAIFSHACAGVLYYKIETPEYTYQFPIDMNNKEDVGTATFVSEYKAITLMRYVRKGIESGDLIQIKK